MCVYVSLYMYFYVNIFHCSKIINVNFHKKACKYIHRNFKSDFPQVIKL